MIAAGGGELGSYATTCLRGLPNCSLGIDARSGRFRALATNDATHSFMGIPASSAASPISSFSRGSIGSVRIAVGFTASRPVRLIGVSNPNDSSKPIICKIILKVILTTYHAGLRLSFVRTNNTTPDLPATPETSGGKAVACDLKLPLRRELQGSPLCRASSAAEIKTAPVKTLAPISAPEALRVMHPLFQAGQGGARPTSALSLFIDDIDFLRARSLNKRWHSTLPRFGTGFIDDQPFPCFAATFDGLIYAVAIWSNPAARNLPQHEWLELRRLAIGPESPRNTASRMLAIMTRLLRKKRPWLTRLISYQDTEAHSGAIYRAAGWVKTTVSADGDDWDRPGRRRPAVQSDAAKQRWEKELAA